MRSRRKILEQGLGRPIANMSFAVMHGYVQSIQRMGDVQSRLLKKTKTRKEREYISCYTEASASNDTRLKDLGS